VTKKINQQKHFIREPLWLSVKVVKMRGNLLKKTSSPPPPSKSGNDLQPSSVTRIQIQHIKNISLGIVCGASYIIVSTLVYEKTD
jgi:hypothetical protein